MTSSCYNQDAIRCEKREVTPHTFGRELKGKMVQKPQPKVWGSHLVFHDVPTALLLGLTACKNLVRIMGSICDVCFQPSYKDKLALLEEEKSNLKIRSNIYSDPCKSSTCRSVKSCISITRITHVLVWYQMQERNNELHNIMNYNYQYLLDDFHHILTTHLCHNNVQKSREEYEQIYCYIIKYLLNACDITQCSKFKRFKMERERESATSDESKGNRNDTLSTSISNLEPEQRSILTNKIGDCSVNQLSHILEYYIVDGIQNLIPYKPLIINYFTINEIDGKILMDINKNEFSNKLIKYLDNNEKLKASISQLIDSLISFNPNNMRSLSISNIKTNVNVNNKKLNGVKSVNDYSHDDSYRVYIELLDNIHCYFVHGYDNAMRLKSEALNQYEHDQNSDIDDEDEKDFYSDYQMLAIKESLQPVTIASKPMIKRGRTNSIEDIDTTLLFQHYDGI